MPDPDHIPEGSARLEVSEQPDVLSPLGISLDVQGRITAISELCLQCAGVTAESVAGLYLWDALVPEAQRELTRSSVLDALDGHDVPPLCFAPGPDGSSALVAWTLTPSTDASGAICGAVLSGIHAGEEALPSNQPEQLRLLVETIGDGLAVVDPDLRFTYANSRLCELLGYPRDRLLGRPATDFLNEENRRILQEQWSRRSAGKRGRYEIQWVREDGRQLDVLLSASPIHDAAGEFRGSFAVISDISGRKQAQRQLEESQRQLSTLLANLPGMAYRCANDATWTMELVSEGCLGLTGYRPEDLAGSHTVAYGEIIHPDDRASVQQLIETCLHLRQAFQLTYRIVTARGEVKWVWEQGSGVWDGDTPVALEGFISDISPMRQAEERLAHANRMLQAIRSVNHLITTEHDRDRLLQGICDLLVQTQGFVFAWIATPGDGPRPNEYAYCGSEAAKAAFETMVQKGIADAVVARATETSSVLSSQDLAGPNPAHADVFVQQHGGSAHVVRLRHGGETFGAMGVVLPATASEAPQDMELLGELGGEIAHGLYWIAVQAERTQSLQSLADSEERYRLLVETMHDGVAIVDSQGALTYANDRFLEILGIDRGAIATTAVGDLLDDDQHQMLLDQMERRRSGCTGHYEIRWRRPAGECVDTLVSAAPLRNRQGAVEGSFVSLTDVTDLKATHEALQRANATLQAVIESAPLALVAVGADGAATLWNGAAERLFGWSLADVVGRNLTDALGASAAQMDEAVQVVLGGGVVTELELELTREDGLPVEVSFTAGLVPQTGEVMAALVDVTHRKQAEEALRQNERRFREMADLLPDMLYEADADLRITYANRAAFEQLGYGHDDLQRGIHLVDIMDRESQVRFGERLERMRAEAAPSVGIWELRRKDGGLIRCEIHSMVLQDASGDFQGIRGVLRDVSDRDKAAESQRLAAVGQLAAGVAHEFNNLLAAMSGRAQLAELIQQPAAYESLIRTVESASERGAEISRKLMDFARPSEPSRRLMPLEDAIEAALAVAQQELQHNDVRVVRDYGTEGRQVQADGAQLEQVFLNLFLNASQVMPEGGVLCIQTRLEGAGGQELVARVGDTGPGIRPEDLPRIFEPFYSVRPLGLDVNRGTGLGLSVAHGIVTAHGGSIRCTSELGRGATFELRLEVADGPAPEAAADATIEPAQTTGKSVLVADDEGDILDVVGYVLKAQGFRVIGVADTSQALDELDKGGYDLVISDLIMPGGGGREIVARAARMTNPIPVIIITGMPEEAVRRDIAGGTNVTVVLKPFGLNEVMDAVNRALATP